MKHFYAIVFTHVENPLETFKSFFVWFQLSSIEFAANYRFCSFYLFNSIFLYLKKFIFIDFFYRTPFCVVSMFNFINFFSSRWPNSKSKLCKGNKQLNNQMEMYSYLAGMYFIRVLVGWVKHLVVKGKVQLH